MTRIDVHPEDLLHSARQGTLGAEDTARLEQHLASCAACHVELGAMQALAQDMAARPGDEALVDRIVRGAAGMRIREPHTGGSQRRFAIQMAAAGVIVGLIGGAAAAYWTFAKLSQNAADVASDGSGSPAGGVEDPAFEATGGSAEPPRLEAPAAPQAAEVPEREATTDEEVAPTRRAESASALLARAGRQRREGNHRRAAQTYRLLQRHHPRSREALLSYVSLGQLLLGPVGDPSAALGQFDAYLSRAGDGVLSEEARVGRALALERLGRTAEARAAWAVVLEHHPGSPNAARARTRLGP